MEKNINFWDHGEGEDRAGLSSFVLYSEQASQTGSTVET